MKTTLRNHAPLATLAVLMALVATGCDSTSSTDKGSEEQKDYTEILARFVDHTVLPTYEGLKDETVLLNEQVVRLRVAKSQTLLDSVCATWRAARIPWEQSESFLFGPAEFRSLDPLLDSWPLDQNQLEQVLASNVEITPSYVRDGLGAVLRGFHTIEFLIFREGKARTVADLTDRELEYLAASTQVLRDDAVTLWAMWKGSEGLDSLSASVMEELGIDPGAGFEKEVKLAGAAGSRYVSQTDAMGEIIEGCLGIADEVGNAKLAEPAAANDPLLVESWFSWNSLTDFHNNVLSIRNSLYGGVEGSRDTTKSLAHLVAASKPDLANQLAVDIQAALDAIDAVPQPFRNNLTSPKVVAAIDAMNNLTTTLEAVRSTVSR